MPKRKLSPINLPPTNDIHELRRSVQDRMNEMVTSINAAEFQSKLNMNFHRIRRVLPGVEDYDAVNLSQLRKYAPLPFKGKRNVGAGIPSAPTYSVAVINWGMLSLTNLTLPDVPFDLHCASLSVDETTMDTDRGTLAEAVDVAEADIDITGLSGVVVGDYLLIHDPSQNGASDVTNDEILYVTAINGNTYSVTRGAWGSSDVAHSSGLYVWPLDIRHDAAPGWPDTDLSDKTSDLPIEFDMVLPTRCVVATKVWCANDSGASEIVTAFLPVYTTDATATPLAPGLRTLYGHEYLLPKTGDQTVADDVMPVGVPVAIPGAIRTIYALIDTPPSGANMIIEVTQDGNTNVLDTITITDGSSFSYVSGNEPRLRQTPYNTNWADLVALKADRLLQFNVTQVGSTTAGSNLMVVVQS